MAKRIKLDCRQPAFAEVINPLALGDFFAKNWEKEHIHIKSDVFKLQFGLEDLWTVVDGNTGLVFGKHLNACKALNNEQVTYESDEVIDVNILKHLWKDGHTFQFFQPQCYENKICDKIYEKMSKLEDEFGALWGSNVYITPNCSQGLVPHYDDAEVFVIQTEGKKQWYIYESVDQTSDLALESSGPLSSEEYGPVSHTYTLSPGDVLYLPRGTIHAAKTIPDEGHSVHITISTYQRNSVGDFLPSALTNLVNLAAPEHRSLRVGMPVLDENFEAHERSVSDLISKSLSDLIKLEKLIHDAAKASVDDFQLDFVINRLPPKVTPEKANLELSVGDKVRAIHPSRYCFLIEDRLEDEDLEEAVDESIQLLKIYNCSDNLRKSHMGLNLNLDSHNDSSPDRKTDCLTIDVTQEQILVIQSLRKSYPGATKITPTNIELLRTIALSGILECL